VTHIKDRALLETCRVDRINSGYPLLVIVTGGAWTEGEAAETETESRGTLIRSLSGDFDWVYSLEMVYGPTPLLASAHRDCRIRLWDYFNEALELPIMILSGHSHAVSSLLVIQGPFPVLVSSSFDATLSVWDLSSKRRLHILRQSHRPIRTLAYLEAEVKTAGIDPPLHQHHNNDDPESGADDSSGSSSASKTGPYVVCGNDEGTIIVWHPRSWLFCKKILHPNAATPEPGSAGAGPVTSAIKSLVCSHWNHEPRVFAGYDDGFLRVFHLHTREQLLCFQAHDHAVRALTIVQVSLSRPVCPPCLIPSLSLSDS
jgi:WD40 repeat protein